MGARNHGHTAHRFGAKENEVVGYEDDLLNKERMPTEEISRNIGKDEIPLPSSAELEHDNVDFGDQTWSSSDGNKSHRRDSTTVDGGETAYRMFRESTHH